ncbi:Arm DNA-binding domain-containing protein [Pseudomonas savastanoi]
MLTDMVVRQAKASDKPYTLADFDGLFLYVSPVGGKAWHFRYTWVGQRARISLGSYPELSLREAREFRDQARALVAYDVSLRDYQAEAELDAYLCKHDKLQTAVEQARLSGDNSCFAPSAIFTEEIDVQPAPSTAAWPPVLGPPVPRRPMSGRKHRHEDPWQKLFDTQAAGERATPAYLRTGLIELLCCLCNYQSPQDHRWSLRKAIQQRAPRIKVSTARSTSC